MHIEHIILYINHIYCGLVVFYVLRFYCVTSLHTVHTAAVTSDKRNDREGDHARASHTHVHTDEDDFREVIRYT